VSDDVGAARKVGSWHDRDREGSWQMWTACRACDRMAHCHGKERELVRCFDCYMADAAVSKPASKPRAGRTSLPRSSVSSRPTTAAAARHAFSGSRRRG